MHFGDKLRQLRKQKDWTQPQLAEAIGIEQSYLSKIENGKSTPSADIFQLILDAFSIDTASLLEEIDSAIIHRQLRQIPEVANFLNLKMATDLNRRKRWLISSALFTSAGILFILSSYLGLLFPETQFNYLSRGVVLQGESKEVFRNYRHQHFESRDASLLREKAMTKRLDEQYLLLSSYRGDTFNLPVEGGSRTYHLLGDSTQARIENRYLAVGGILFALLGVFGFILEKKIAISR